MYDVDLVVASGSGTCMAGQTTCLSVQAVQARFIVTSAGPPPMSFLITTPQQPTTKHEPRSATGETPVATLEPNRTASSGKYYSGSSSKIPHLPTSLSTIIEYTKL